MTRILRIDSSARGAGSVSRAALDRIVAAHPNAQVETLDLGATPLPQIDETWVGATFTPPEARTLAQSQALELSDRLVAQIQGADLVLIGVPIYNFGVPAALKAWMDQVARAGVTFRYTANGSEGLLRGKRAIVAVASGGVPIGAPMDFATPHLRQFLGFLGISEVEIIAAATLAEAA